MREHPHDLEDRWQVYAAAKKWDAALDIAVALKKLVLSHPAGWLLRSQALREMGRTQEACSVLRSASARFPKWRPFR